MSISAFPIVCKSAGIRITEHFYMSRAIYIRLQVLHTFVCCPAADVSVILNLYDK